MALSKGAKKFGTFIIVAAVLGGVGYKVSPMLHKKAITTPTPVQEQVTSATQEAPAPKIEQVPSNGTAPAVEAIDKKVEEAPVKKHVKPHTAGHAVKHDPVKHQSSTKSTPHLSGSTSTHSEHKVSDADAMKELSKQGGF